MPALPPTQQQEQQHGVRSVPSVSSLQREHADGNRSRRSDSPSDPQGSLILRIKRKRGVDPITALRIETLANEAAGDDGDRASDLQTGVSPDDNGARVLHKRRLTDRGVFRLAETVSLASFDNVEQTKLLEERIAKLKQPQTADRKSGARSPAEGQERAAAEGSSAKSSSAASASSAPLPSNLRFKVISQPKAAPRRSLFDALKANNNSSGSLRLKAQRHARTAVKARRTLPGDGRSKPYSRPRYIDAVVEGSKGERSASRMDEDIASLDKRFAGLLGDYLKEQDLEPPSDIHSALNNPTSPKLDDEQNDNEEDEDEDYVYDIYYRVREYTRDAPSAFTAANVGLQPSEVAGHTQEHSLSNSISSLGARTPSHEPMATLVGLSSDFELADDEEIEKGSRLVSEEMLDSDDPYEEGEDEDSNDEGFYRNDYPEQEADDDDDLDASAWGWSGPRRIGQRRTSESDDDDEEEESEEDFDDSGF